jgi:hypothetical protein
MHSKSRIKIIGKVCVMFKRIMILSVNYIEVSLSWLTFG